MAIRHLATLALILAPSVAVAQPVFQTPSGNIHCAAQNGEIQCRVLQFVREPGWRVRDCAIDSVALRPKGEARLICDGDMPADRRTPVLGYDQPWRQGGLECVASRTALRCANGDGRGFELSRARGVQTF